MPQNKPSINDMGSQSDYSTMKYAEDVLKNLKIDMKLKLYHT